MILLVGATGVVRGVYPAVAINGGDELWYVELPAPKGKRCIPESTMTRGRPPRARAARPASTSTSTAAGANESKGTLTIRESSSTAKAKPRLSRQDPLLRIRGVFGAGPERTLLREAPIPRSTRRLFVARGNDS